MNTFPKLAGRIALVLALAVGLSLPAAAGTFTPEWNVPKTQTAVTVLSTATALIATPDNTRKRAGVWLQPTDGDIWIGDSTVAVGKGTFVPQYTIIAMEWTYGTQWYAIRNSSTNVVTQVTLVY